MDQQQVKVEISEIPRPSGPKKRFDTENAYKEMKTLIDKKLDRKTYETDEAAKISKELADELRNKMKIGIPPQYKIFTVVSLFSQKGQGIRQSSRCYFDPETDYEITYIYENPDLVCVSTVYAVYFY